MPGLSYGVVITVDEFKRIFEKEILEFEETVDENVRTNLQESDTTCSSPIFFEIFGFKIKKEGFELARLYQFFETIGSISSVRDKILIRGYCIELAQGKGAHEIGLTKEEKIEAVEEINKLISKRQGFDVKRSDCHLYYED